MLCETCERHQAVAYVRIEEVDRNPKKAWLGQGYLCRACLRNVCRAMRLEFPLAEVDMPNLFGEGHEEETTS